MIPTLPLCACITTIMMNLSLFILTLSIITASATATSSAATISISATTSSPTTLAVDITTTTATADTATIPTTTTSITATYKNDKKPLVDLVESKNDGSNIWNMNDIHSTEDQDNFGMHIVSLHSREDPQDSSRVPIMVEIPDSTGKSGSNIPRALHSTTPTKLGSKNKKNDGDNNKAKTRHGRTDDNPKKDFPNISTPNHLKKSSRISNSNTQSSINHINNNITDHANINATTNHNLTNDTQDWKEPPTAPRTIVITLCIVIASLIGCFLCIIGMFKLVNVYCLGRFDHRKPTFVRLVSLKRQQQQQQQQQQHDHYPYKKHPHSISGKMISLPKPLLEPLNDSDIPSRNSDTSKTSKQLLRIKTEANLSPTALHITSPLDCIPPRRPSHHDSLFSPCSSSSPSPSSPSPSPSPSSATFPLLRKSSWPTNDDIDSISSPLPLHHYDNHHHLSPYSQQSTFTHYDPTFPSHVKSKRMPVTRLVSPKRTNSDELEGHRPSKDQWSLRSIQSDLSSFPWDRPSRSNY